MHNRRDFLRNSILAAGALGLRSEALIVPPLPAQDMDEEKYWKLIREQFPLSHQKIFLNNGTIGPSPYPVVSSVYKDMMEVDTEARYAGMEDEARQALAVFLGTDKSEISLTRNCTEGINICCWGLPLREGDEVILSRHEHVGNAGPWLNRAKLTGIKIKAIPLGQTAEQTLDIVKKTVTRKTKVIALPQIPCTIGQILPTREICAFAKERGIFSFVDGAHPPGMLETDLHQLGCDMYSGCCHKWMLGPKGTGFLYVAKDFRNTVQAFYGGGGVDTGWDLLTDPPLLKGYVDDGHRYYYGTQNASLFQGIVKAVEFHEAIGKEKIEKRVRKLAAYLQENLLKLIPEIEMLTPVEAISRGAQIGFRIKGKEMADLQAHVRKKGIIVRYVPENNINCLRVSTHIYNSFKEIDTFLQATEEFAKGSA